MKLMTQAIIKQLPALYAQEETATPEKDVHIKFFVPGAGLRWYVTEGDPIVLRDGEQEHIQMADLREDDEIVDWLFFNLMTGRETEWGYITLSQLKSIKVPMYVGKHLIGHATVERDRNFTCKVAEIPGYEEVSPVC